MLKSHTKLMRRGLAAVLSAALTVSALVTSIGGDLLSVSADGEPTKTVLLDSYDGTNTYFFNEDRGQFPRIDGEDNPSVAGGEITLRNYGNELRSGFNFKGALPAGQTLDLTDCEYLEFDIWTDNADVWKKANDCRIMLGEDGLGEGMAYTAKYQIVKERLKEIELKAGEWVHVKIPFSSVTVRAEAGGTPLASSKLNSYRFMTEFNKNENNANILQETATTLYTIKLKNLMFTSYKVDTTPAAPTKNLVIDDFSTPGNYAMDSHGSNGTLSVSDGSLTMKNTGQGANYGFHYNAVNLDAFTTTGYEYIEFDIWTDNPDIYVKSSDARVNMGRGAVDRTHDIGNLAQDKANAVGPLTANAVTTVRLPLSNFTVRTDDNAKTENPDGKPATDFTFDRYTLMIGYNGSFNLGSGATWTVRVDEVRLTAYEAANQEAVDAVQEAIAAIGLVTSHDSDELVEAARAAYDVLNPKEKALVTNYADLTAAEALLESMPYKTAVFDPYDEETVTYTRIPGVIGNQGIAVADNILTITAPSDNTRQGYGYRAYLPGIQSMSDYEYVEFDLWTNNAEIFQKSIDGRFMMETYTQIGSDSEDTTKATHQYSFPKNAVATEEWVHFRIPFSAFSIRAEANGIPLADATTVNAYRLYIRYNSGSNLGEGDFRVQLRNMVLTSYEKPTTDEWNQMKAAEVDAMIDAIGSPVTLESEEAITAARSAYNKLKAEQKALVTKLETLTAAEAALASLKSDAAVAEVIRLIDAIDQEITLESGSGIQAARAAYNALTQVERAKVTNYQKLSEAELKWAELDAQANPATQSVVVDPFDGDYVYTKMDNKVFTYEVKGGELTMTSWANDHEHGFNLQGTLPSIIQLNHFDYLEFDIWTSNGALYTNALDCRFWLMGDNGASNQNGYNSNAASTKEAIGTLETGEWVHVKFPLELIFNRADSNIKANNAKVDSYRIQMVYNGENNLGGSEDNPVTVKFRNLTLTSYQEDASYTVTPKRDSEPIREVMIEDFDDVSYMAFDQALEYYVRDEYLEITNLANQHDAGFDFTMNYPQDIDISGCDYLEFDLYTNDVGIIQSGLDCRMFLAFSGVMDGLNANQLMASKMKELLVSVEANQWTHVRIPLSAFTYSSENVNQLDMDLETLCKIAIFFRFNGTNKLDGYTEDNPAFIRIKNLKATQYEGTPSFISSNQEFTVTFKGADGATIQEVKVKYGHAPEAPAAPVRDGFTFTGWDTDFSYVTRNITVTAQYHDDSQANLKAEAEAALAQIASSITSSNLERQAELVAAARQAVATLINKYPSVSISSVAGYAKLATAEQQILALTKTAVGIDGVKDSLYTQENSIDLDDYTSAIGNEKLPLTATDGKAYYAWDDDFIYVYIEYPDTVERIEARIDTDPSLNRGDYRNTYATYTEAQSDAIIRRNTDGTLYCSTPYGTAVNMATLEKDGVKALEFAWPRQWASGSSAEDHFGLSVYATRPDPTVYTVSAYYDWDDYSTIHYYYTMSREELIAQAESLIDAIGEVTEENWSDKDEAIEAARTLIDNARTSYDDFSTDLVSNYIKLREAEHKFNYYFAGGEGTAPSMPPLEEIDLVVSTQSEDININLLSKVIQVYRKMTVEEFLGLLEYDEGTPTVINRDGRVLKGTSYVHDDLRMMLTIEGVGQATFDILYLGEEEITEPDELEPLPENPNLGGTDPGDSANPGDGDDGTNLPDTGVQTFSLAALLLALGAVAVAIVFRRKQIR